METLAWVFADRRRDAPAVTAVPAVTVAPAALTVTVAPAGLGAPPASSLNDPWPARGRPDRGRQG
jgi:hypothetical protein